MADRRPFWLAAVLAVSLSLARVAAAEDTERLTVMIRDGEVLFHGAELDVEQLQSQLTASGLQGSRVYVRLASGANSVFIDRVVSAIRSAGFTDIILLGPSGMEKALEPPV